MITIKHLNRFEKHVTNVIMEYPIALFIILIILCLHLISFGITFDNILTTNYSDTILSFDILKIPVLMCYSDSAFHFYASIIVIVTISYLILKYYLKYKLENL